MDSQADRGRQDLTNAGVLFVGMRRISSPCARLVETVAAMVPPRRAGRQGAAYGRAHRRFLRDLREPHVDRRAPGMPRSGRGSLYERSLSVVQPSRTALPDMTFGRSSTWAAATSPTCRKSTPSSTGTCRTSATTSCRRWWTSIAALPWGEFRLGDITAPGFRAEADLVVVKDVLFHLEDDQIDAALRNLASSPWSYLLLTSTDNDSNVDHVLDRWHSAPVNFCAPPYSFSPDEVLEHVDGGGFRGFRPDGFTWPQ